MTIITPPPLILNFSDEVCDGSSTVGILMLIKIQPGATVCRYLFTAKTLYMFQVSQHPSSGVLKTVTTASGTATSLQHGLIGPRWREVAVPVL